MINLILYSTTHCHLCEQAQAFIQKISSEYAMNCVTVEITDDASLYERYEIKIPVLKRIDTAEEIYWPFNESDIRLLLGEINNSN